MSDKPKLTEEDRTRTPVSSHYDGDNDVVICDDGSVWFYRESKWKELDPIPGSRRAGQKASSR